MDYDDLTPAIEKSTSMKYDIELKPKFIIPKLQAATHFGTLPTTLKIKLL